MIAPHWFDQRELLIADWIWRIELSYGTCWVICDVAREEANMTK